MCVRLELTDNDRNVRFWKIVISNETLNSKRLQGRKLFETVQVHAEKIRSEFESFLRLYVYSAFPLSYTLIVKLILWSL